MLEDYSEIKKANINYVFQNSSIVKLLIFENYKLYVSFFCDITMVFVSIYMWLHMFNYGFIIGTKIINRLHGYLAVHLNSPPPKISE